jgi:hypothetical protein
MGMRVSEPITAPTLRIDIAAVTRMKELTMSSIFQRPRVVRVCSYVRFRFGRQEHVITHLRSLPT